jgi:hypothetical protein
VVFDDYVQYDGLGLAELIAKGEVHPKEVLEAAILRTEKVQALGLHHAQGVGGDAQSLAGRFAIPPRCSMRLRGRSPVRPTSRPVRPVF